MIDKKYIHYEYGKVTLPERQQWLIDWIKDGNALYIESMPLVRAFHKKFFPENIMKDKYGFSSLTKKEETVKEIQKNLRKLSKEKFIEKKALGVFEHKDAWLGRNWIWAWRLTGRLGVGINPESKIK